jgi:hypothetical protein
MIGRVFGIGQMAGRVFGYLVVLALSRVADASFGAVCGYKASGAGTALLSIFNGRLAGASPKGFAR